MNKAEASFKRRAVTYNFEGGREENVDNIRPVKRSRILQEDLIPDEKREKLLEQNRAAATRFREKRKLWIQALERKATEMSELNSQLQQQNYCLKQEIAQLKGLLLVHRDCPLFLTRQKK